MTATIPLLIIRPARVGRALWRRRIRAKQGRASLERSIGVRAHRYGKSCGRFRSTRRTKLLPRESRGGGGGAASLYLGDVQVAERNQALGVLVKPLVGLQQQLYETIHPDQTDARDAGVCLGIASEAAG
jgi:hypothetical protein